MGTPFPGSARQGMAAPNPTLTPRTGWVLVLLMNHVDFVFDIHSEMDLWQRPLGRTGAGVALVRGTRVLRGPLVAWPGVTKAPVTEGQGRRDAWPSQTTQ